MERSACWLAVIVLTAMPALAWADNAPTPMQPVAAPAPAATPPTTPEADRPVSAAAAADSPRRTRWAPMTVEYLMANTRHPPLVFDSPQEKLKHDDARARGPVGTLVAAVFEIAHFPAHLALCPYYLATKPVWCRERAEP
jgi:hypothetical protein